MNYVDVMGCDVCISPDCKAEPICKALSLFSKAIDKSKSTVQNELRLVLSQAVSCLWNIEAERSNLKNQLDVIHTTLETAMDLADKMRTKEPLFSKCDACGGLVDLQNAKWRAINNLE